MFIVHGKKVCLSVSNECSSVQPKIKEIPSRHSLRNRSPNTAL